MHFLEVAIIATNFSPLHTMHVLSMVGFVTQIILVHLHRNINEYCKRVCSLSRICFGYSLCTGVFQGGITNSDHFLLHCTLFHCHFKSLQACVSVEVRPVYISHKSRIVAPMFFFLVELVESTLCFPF